MRSITKKTLKEVNQLIKKYTKELTKDLTIGQLINMNHLQLNIEAIKLAQTEFNKK